jgi:hypothetical protein
MRLRQLVSWASSESLSGPKLFSKVLIQICQIYSGCNLLFFSEPLGSRLRPTHSECSFLLGAGQIFAEPLGNRLRQTRSFDGCNRGPEDGVLLKPGKGSRWHRLRAGAAKTVFASLDPNITSLIRNATSCSSEATGGLIGII